MFLKPYFLKDWQRSFAAQTFSVVHCESLRKNVLLIQRRVCGSTLIQHICWCLLPGIESKLLFMDAQTTWSWSTESLDCGAVWLTAVLFYPVTTGCDGNSLGTLTYCVFISSGQAPMQLQPWINAALSRVFPLGAAVHSPSATHMLSNPSKCKLAARAATNIQDEWQFSLQSKLTLGTTFSISWRSSSAQQILWNQARPSTVCTWCVYTMHTSLKSGEDKPHTLNHFTIPGSCMTHWFSADVPKAGL